MAGNSAADLMEVASEGLMKVPGASSLDRGNVLEKVAFGQ